MTNESLPKEEEKEVKQRVIALLTRKEIDFLDKLSNDSRFSTGKKFAHTKIISSLVEMMMRLGINGQGLKSAADLEERIRNAIIKDLVTTSIAKPPADKKGAFIPAEVKIKT